jgi:hypothetical protein
MSSDRVSILDVHVGDRIAIGRDTALVVDWKPYEARGKQIGMSFIVELNGHDRQLTFLSNDIVTRIRKGDQ